MKVKKSEIQLLIAVLGILLAVVTYFLVYAKFNDLADSMESQNMSLRSQVSTLEVDVYKRQVSMYCPPSSPVSRSSAVWISPRRESPRMAVLPRW